jgi:diadenosine tetraphosphate (Ap4A) HIT family hydrolase
MKLLETETIFAFMDIGPIAKGHCLVIPKCKSFILESHSHKLVSVEATPVYPGGA